MQQQDAQTTAPDDIIQALRERRLITLALADQVAEARWAMSALPDARTLHDALARLLAWNEWAIAVFELSLLRPLPLRLITPTHDDDEAAAFEERAQARSVALSKDDLLGGLQTASGRLISAAMGRNLPDWLERPLADLAGSPIFADATVAQTPAASQNTPTVGDVLRWLLAREHTLDTQLEAGLGVSVNMDELKKRLTNG